MSLLIQSLKLVPKNALSRVVGGIARLPVPAPVAQASIRAFASAYRIDVDEAEREVGGYSTLGDFFTRRLKDGARPIDPSPDVACSPVDGAVGQAGPIEDGRIIQAKGRSFTVAELLANEEEARAYEGGTFATLYLAPYNYHRIHSPLAGRIVGSAHVPGHLWPVNALGVAEVDRLFAVNERLITHLETDAGKIAVVKVGATCVGRIRVAYDDVVTNDGGPKELRERRYDPPFEVAKGDELGVFELGSTVIVLFQRDRAVLEPGIVPGAPVVLGRPLARVAVDAVDSSGADRAAESL